MKVTSHLVSILSTYAKTDDRIWILDADLGDSYGITPSIIKALEERFIQSGIAEQNMVSVAAGISILGNRPWVFSFAAFLVSRSFDQIRIGLSQTGLPITIVGASSGIGAIQNGSTHLCLNDIALISSLPGIDIWSPFQQSDLEYVVNSVLARNRPAYIRMPRFGVVGKSIMTCPVTIFGDGKDILLLSTGISTRWALEIQKQIADYSVSITVVYVSLIMPLPSELDDVFANEYGQIVTLEDHYVCGGFGDILTHAYPQYTIKKLGWPTKWISTSFDEDNVRRQHRMDIKGLLNILLK